MKIRRVAGVAESADYPQLWAALQMCAAPDRGAAASACVGLRNRDGIIAMAVETETDEEFEQMLRCLGKLGFRKSAGGAVAGYRAVFERESRATQG